MLSCARRQGGLITRAQALAHGLSPATVDRWARSRWSTVLPGVYDTGCDTHAASVSTVASSGSDPDPELEAVRRLARAASLKWGNGLVVSGRSAAALLGYPLPRTPPAWCGEFGLPPDPTFPRLTVTLPPGRKAQAAPVRVDRRELASADIVRMAEAWVTSPVRTTADLLRSEPLLTAVAAADAAVRRSRTTLRMVESEIVTGVGRRGAAQARRALELLDPACESPLETMLRLLLYLAGLPRPVSQFEVRAHGQALGRADFAYPDAGLVLECDGRAYHQEWSAGVRDRRRQNRFVVEAGLRALRFTYDDLALRPGAVAAEVRAALGGPART